MGLDNDQLHQIQFYSGPIKIVFAAQTDEVIKQIQRDALITTNQQTGHRLTIPKETPGALVRMDYISRELLVRFDPDFPPLVYQDLGLGLELITTEVESEGLTYKRVLESPRGPRGRLKAQDRRLLTVRKKEKTESKLERKKVSGIKTSP